MNPKDQPTQSRVTETVYFTLNETIIMLRWSRLETRIEPYTPQEKVY